MPRAPLCARIVIVMTDRAFHGDVVAVTLYPEVEWMQVIKQDIIDFKNVLDERDRIRVLEEE